MGLIYMIYAHTHKSLQFKIYSMSHSHRTHMSVYLHCSQLKTSPFNIFLFVYQIKLVRKVLTRTKVLSLEAVVMLLCYLENLLTIIRKSNLKKHLRNLTDGNHILLSLLRSPHLPQLWLRARLAFRPHIVWILSLEETEINSPFMEVAFM